MSRRALGLLAFALLVGGAALWLWSPGLGYQQLHFGLLRLGAVLAVLWLAYDDLMRLPGWLLAGVPVLAVVLARWPRWLVLAVPVVVVLAILRPRWGRGAADVDGAGND